MFLKSTIYWFVLCCFSFATEAQQPASYAERMANTALEIFTSPSINNPGKPAKWEYDQALVSKAIEGVWHKTGDKKYFDYIQRMKDIFIGDDGSILSYKKSDYNIDNVLGGRVLLTLYGVTRKVKYYKAAAILREQLREQPRLQNGGFWHKKRYPNQMWLDGLYMGEPFYAEWAATFHEDTAFNDIAKQFILMESNAREPKTGLLYHGYDESRKEKWADPVTGLSRNFWGRAMGWYGMGLVDALEYFPKDHPRRKALLDILNRFAEAISKVQDEKSGLWWDVLNFPGREGNYLESSASSMFVYTLAKGVRLGYLPARYVSIAQKGYAGILKNFIEEKAGRINLTGTVSVSGLGGKPYRDGSYEYYVNEKVVTNDPKGIGAFILAANEMELLPTLSIGKGKKVLLDAYFNNESKKDAAGIDQPYHYQWSDQSNGGFSVLGYLFRSYGVQTNTLREAPSKKRLHDTDIYIIVDPDSKKEVATPNFIRRNDIKTIRKWVKKGGVLLLFANDSSNTELRHFNDLAGVFGIHWSNASRNWVKDNQFETGAITVSQENPVFDEGLKLYLKEICLIEVTPPAKALLREQGDVIMATAQYGKGAVFAVGDPWLYNEYVDGRKLPATFQNAEAARDLIKWSIKQSK